MDMCRVSCMVEKGCEILVASAKEHSNLVCPQWFDADLESLLSKQTPIHELKKSKYHFRLIQHTHSL